MTAIVAFLRARLDEDEQAARAAGNRQWLVGDNTISLWPEREDDGFMSWPTRADARHAAKWEPARVLREIGAKREALDHYERIRQHTVRSDEAYVLAEGAVRKHIQIMALPYADHPDYRQEWRP